LARRAVARVAARPAASAVRSDAASVALRTDAGRRRCRSDSRSLASNRLMFGCDCAVEFVDCLEDGIFSLGDVRPPYANPRTRAASVPLRTGRTGSASTRRGGIVVAIAMVVAVAKFGG
jgi:hypothetical protein